LNQSDAAFLPDISKRVASKSSNRTQQTMSTDLGLKKASPEALALIMKNIKKEPIKKKVWVPSGVSTSKEHKAPKKIFF